MYVLEARLATSWRQICPTVTLRVRVFSVLPVISQGEMDCPVMWP